MGKSKKPVESYYLAKEIETMLKKSYEVVTKANQDRVFIVTGFEGSGKSTLAMQLAYFFDKTFSIEDICFTSEAFSKRLQNSKKLKAIIFDEAFNGLSSKGALSKKNKEIVRILQECRQRNLFIFIVLPSIFLLEKYVALFRSTCCFHCSIYKKDYTKRYYKVFNRTNKQLLYLLGHKMMSYSKPRIFHKHRFYGKYPPSINGDEYEEKKRISFVESPKKNSVDDKIMYQRDVLMAELYKTKDYTFKQISEVLNKRGCTIDKTWINRKVLKVLEEPLKV